MSATPSNFFTRLENLFYTEGLVVTQLTAWFTLPRLLGPLYKNLFKQKLHLNC